jgi:hypothetical protein
MRQTQRAAADVLGGRRQPSTGGTSRVTGDGQARISERLGRNSPGLRGSRKQNEAQSDCGGAAKTTSNIYRGTTLRLLSTLLANFTDWRARSETR